jgi:hypothetical protein
MDGQSLQEFGKAHWVQAEFAEPLVLDKDSKLLIEMKHLYGGGRNVGPSTFLSFHGWSEEG